MKYLHRLRALGVDDIDVAAAHEEVAEHHTSWMQARQAYGLALSKVARLFYVVYQEIPGLPPTVHPVSIHDIEALLTEDGGEDGIYMASSAEEAVAKHRAKRLADLQVEINALMEQPK